MAIAIASPQNAAPERTPLLKSQSQDPEADNTTFPKGPEPKEEDWKPPKGFWIIQVGKSHRVMFTESSRCTPGNRADHPSPLVKCLPFRL